MIGDLTKPLPRLSVRRHKYVLLSATIGRRPNGFLGLSLKDRTILLLAI